jgi:hypothetical protein
MHMSDPARSPTNRRKFLFACTAAAAAPLAARSAFAQSKEKVDENSPQAKALNYRHDAKQVKDPKHKPDQFCSNCQLYQGKASDAWGPCALFAGNLVAAKGWCNAWVKKA